MTLAENPAILRQTDPEPVTIVNEQSRAPLLLLCEHAGQSIPQCLNRLGLPQHVIDSHRGWDIGALAVAREVAARLSAPLVIQNYSRLVIDANRPPDGAHAVPAEVDGVTIPGNVGITPAEQRQRAKEIFAPLDAVITDLVHRLKPRGCFSIHSFTPVLGGVPRPWHAGFLSRCDTRSAETLMKVIASRQPDLLMAVNEPYRIDDETDWFIPRHAEPSGAAHCLIEIRNDLISSPEGVTQWADWVAEAITAVMQEAKK
ncbi:N-formylglutamate amidohydrolase [Sulfitobacter aestuariivivens]|uniref:N-formylglutamate amidohydrolase n=1 Tax=Sulfitobacter aestuariivivens TaxID=2766981 RepID=A0A927D310_9RHOB|nr:N-formylglutamate amidohydrolase [Sulfitobacter aestuariivivens]MBD3664100.1 N-formylglutamate amidohydrolase [Sulfitobacter aestuariivivens]